ncbi:MAG TPA: 30S ribosomal protein S8 [Candidatus Hydrogenedentes bacterium]|mgnify:CR=1 FL=1|nr:30S ribosomal protein S8 [Candidatus Hydrogenedentota bacterium]
MSMTDPIADLLTRMRNAIRAGQTTAEIPASKLKAEICQVLKQEGYLKDFVVVEDTLPAMIRVTLKYLPDRTPVMRGLRRVSRPSLRVYVDSSGIKPVRSGLGISVLSTSQGLMTGKQARKAGIGGEILCEVW